MTELNIEKLKTGAQLKLILDEKTVCFVEDNGTPVGIALGIPDINILFKQIRRRLTPAGIITLLPGRKKINDYRLWGLMFCCTSA